MFQLFIYIFLSYKILCSFTYMESKTLLKYAS
jgi:hypothetical protein